MECAAEGLWRGFRGWSNTALLTFWTFAWMLWLPLRLRTASSIIYLGWPVMSKASLTRKRRNSGMVIRWSLAVAEVVKKAEGDVARANQLNHFYSRFDISANAMLWHLLQLWLLMPLHYHLLKHLPTTITPTSAPISAQHGSEDSWKDMSRTKQLALMEWVKACAGELGEPL